MFGAAIFSNPKSYDPASVNNGALALGRIKDSQVIKAIGGSGELANNIKWLTNFTSETAYFAQLKNTPKLLEDKYLRTAVSSIILELGLKHSSFEDKASVIADVFNNTMLLAKHFYSIVEAPKGALASGLTTKLGHYQIPIEDRSLESAVSQSVQSFTNCERRATNNARLEFVSVVLPRVDHARNLLSGGVPMDNLVWLSESQLPPVPNRLNWACNIHLPLLVEIKISKISPSYSGLINWGNGAGSIIGKAAYAVSNERLFVTNNELKFLSTFADIQIGKIAICESELDFRYTLPIDTELARTSYSYGLLSENIWCALLRDSNGAYRRGFSCSWLHAADRMRCLEFAKVLFDKGYAVNGYGYGRITLAVTEAEKKILKHDCLRLGLLPFVDHIHSDETESLLNSLDSSSDINKMIFGGSRSDLIQLFDNSFVDEVING